MSELRLELSDAHEQLIRAHGERDYPHECCGVLIGRAAETHAVVTEVFTIENQRTENRERRFLISPQDYRAAEAKANALGQAVLGFYHSHPDHPAIPSEFDREHAIPFLSYIIVSVRQGKSAELRSWQLQISRDAYDEEKILTGQSLDA
jgi:proteasome lid subunit RPN8/RPN11